MLDPDICYRAARARDERFDGRFFIGVRSTRIFCRAVCPVPLPRKENILFLPSAAAAQAEGFRPCLRCRPESAPSTPAWQGTGATVRRALRRIEEGALSAAPVAALAAELGVGERQLRRLFQKHLGATPHQVARTERILLAKRLLDETTLSITEVGLAAGFGSQRRFNDAIRGVYGRSPRELRRTRLADGAKEVAVGVPLQLRFRPAYDWRGLRRFLASRAIPGVEEVVGDSYRRVVSVGSRAGFLEVGPSSSSDALLARLHLPERTPLMPLVSRLKRLLDVDADSEVIDEHLSRDPRLRPLVERFPGTRVPGCWDRFELAVRAILEQLGSAPAASRMAGRIVERFGARASIPPPFESGLTSRFPQPDELAEADLGEAGVPAPHAAIVRGFAAAAASGALDLESVDEAAEAARALESLPGIERRTAHYFAMRAARDPDVFPETDLDLRRALAGGGRLPPPGRALAASRSWRPWRSYAVVYLWRSLG